jgi:predicted O-methyltransferase YrrM
MLEVMPTERGRDMEFEYAHNDTSQGEKHSSTAQFVHLQVCEPLAQMRKDAFARNIPTADDETLQFLMCMAAATKPKHILELGTAVGISGIALLQTCPQAHLTTVEKNADFFAEATLHFKTAGLENRVTAICGDAGEVIQTLNGTYDFIFLDSAKVQYVKYLPRLKQLLASGGVLLADDVLLYGWVNDEAPTPPKRKMLVEHIREYIQAATSDPELITTVVNIGDGICMSIKK